MKWPDAVLHMESLEYETDLMVVSSHSHLLRAIEENGAVKTLVDNLTDHDVMEYIESRFDELCREKTNLEYLNERDIVLTTYLWATQNVRLAYKVLQLVSNGWYCKKTAMKIIEQVSHGEEE